MFFCIDRWRLRVLNIAVALFTRVPWIRRGLNIVAVRFSDTICIGDIMSRSGLIWGVIVCALVLGLSSCSVSDGDESVVTGGKRVSLFDGISLDGWTILNCEAVVDSGDILLVKGNGLVQSDGQYGDFVLEFEWKMLGDDKWDSGVYFRYDSVPEGRPWPNRYQVNLRQGMEGNVGALEDARCEGFIKAGQWNRFKLTVAGTKASLEINGQPAWEADGLGEPAKGYIALQAEVPGGGKHRFRNIYVTELK